MKYRFLLFTTFFIVSIAYTQKRQADSMRQKQLEYNQKLLEEERVKKNQQDHTKTNPTVVVSYDSKGNKIETIKTADGQKVVTTTIKLPAKFNVPFNPDTINKDSIKLHVTKSKFRMQVFYKGKVLTMYKCVFGPYHLLQKQQEGDRRTPEGTFTILDIKKHDKWDVFMLLDYPNENSWANFEKNKQTGEIPYSARIGGLVGIHGIWPNGDNVIDLKHNWTDGCVALKNKDVEELAKIVKAGVTKIFIEK